MLIFFTTENFGASPAPYVILMPKGYIDSNLPPSRDQIAHFGHEVVHQTQATERYTTWGEAQAYIYSGKIAEELGGKPLGIEQNIYDIALDINIPGLTTRDLHKLCQVREEILKQWPSNTFYRIFPNRINYLISPQWYTYCEP